MKRIWALIGMAIILTGCTIENDPLDRAMTFRDALLSANGCSYDVEVTADYGEDLYTFCMNCQGSADGNVTFAVTGPELISGITGSLSHSGGALTFDDTALHFDLLADDYLSPVSAPWILLRTLRGGCITSACMEEELLRITADDSYEEDALMLDIWLDGDNRPQRADVVYDGKRILSLKVENFTLL